MKMDTKKIAATFAILMIALSIAGFAYAHWEKIVTIDGTVTTGTLHVIPSLHAELTQDKPVATLDYDVYPEENDMDIWLDNVYPCLWVNGWIDFENTGTIPVHLVDVECSGNETLELVYVGYNETTGYYEYAVCDGELSIANLYVKPYFPDGTATDPYQIDPEGTAYLYFMLHFKEDLPKGVSYWFHLEFEFWNWNEWPVS